jgi:hypothetical protein
MHDLIAETIQRIKESVAKQGLQMNPRLTEDNVSAFEQKHGVELPRGYRQFITEIGNGGEGPPFYGLLALGEVPDDHDRSDSEVLHDIRKPFPLTKGWVWEGEQDEKPELHQTIDHGNLVLGTDGCAIYWLLVVSGAERGQIWCRVDVGIQPCAPRRDFLSWYEHWLGGGKDWWANLQYQ